MAAIVKVVRETQSVPETTPWVLPGRSEVVVSGREYAIYGSLAGADAYHFSAAWSSASTDSRKRALAGATRWLDRGQWPGTKTGGPLDWPRTGASCDGAALDPEVVPPQIVQATYELALVMLSEPDADTKKAVKSASAGSVSVTFEVSSRPGRLPDHIAEIVACLLPGGAVAGSYSAETEEESQFEDDDRLSLSEGLA